MNNKINLSNVMAFKILHSDDTFFPTRIRNKHTKSEGSSEIVLLELIPNASTIFKNKILCLNCFKFSF